MNKPSSHIITLIKKDILLEIRQQYTFYGIALYVMATIFVVYLTLETPEDKVWNSLFWVIQLFVCVNAVAKSFLGENKNRLFYFYSIAGATQFIVAKLLFNAVLMIVMTLLSLFVFILFLGNPLVHVGEFVGISCLGGVGLGLTFTFLAAIAAKAQQQAALMAIMGFPIITPQLLLLNKVANIAFSSIVQSNLWQMTLLLIAFDVLIVVLAIILFPFLWKD